jgi:hypothetical protein
MSSQSSSAKQRRTRSAEPHPDQLPLFPEPDPPFMKLPNPEATPPTSVLDWVKARVEHGPEMTQEDYKRWVRILVLSSIKRIENER